MSSSFVAKCGVLLDKIMKSLHIPEEYRKSEDKRRSFQPPALSAGNSPLHLSARSLAYAPSGGPGADSEAQCALCKSPCVEPRVLACLHTFCTRCLQGLRTEGSQATLWSEVDEQPYEEGEAGGSRSGSGSAGSGYESDPRNKSASEASWRSDQGKKIGIYTRKISGKSVQILCCPTCSQETQLPLGGIAALPLNYVLQHRMLLASLNRDKSRILCDLCTTDVQADSRCTVCLLSVCSFCKEAHLRQRATSRHELVPLASDLVRLRRTRMCAVHADNELKIYCATCAQVICRDCCVLSHSGHALEAARRAAEERARVLRDAVQRARDVPALAARAAHRLHAEAHRIDGHATAVEEEIVTFNREYALAVENHGRTLSAAAQRARARTRAAVATRTRQLDQRAEEARRAVRFAEEALSEAHSDELLALSGAILRRLEHCADLAPLLRDLPARHLALVRSPAGGGGGAGFPLVGRVVTQDASPLHCKLDLEGLQDMRVHRRHHVTLQLRDCDGEPLSHGGARVGGFYRHRDSSARPEPAAVADNQDGTYTLSLAPAAPGPLQLAVLVNNQPIKDSPFACSARVSRPHAGQFHCCAFCSSGGDKRALCGCGASMGGGYKGCGHGHAGHPGGRHWSCCGNTRQHSECAAPAPAPAATPAPAVYQFSL